MNDLSEAERQAIEQNISVSVSIQKAAPYIGAVLGPIAVTFLAGIFFLGTLLVRGQTAFPKVLSVTAYSGFATGLVQYLLTAVVVVIKPPDIDAILEQNMTMSNLGLLVPKDAPVWISVLLKQFDFFTIWYLVLITIGLAAVCYKKRPGQMAIIPFGLWFLWILVRVAFSLILKA